MLTVRGTIVGISLLGIIVFSAILSTKVGRQAQIETSDQTFSQESSETSARELNPTQQSAEIEARELMTSQEETEIETRELTRSQERRSNIPDEALFLSADERSKNKSIIEKHRAEAIKFIEYAHKEMQTNGYVVVDDETISKFDYVIESNPNVNGEDSGEEFRDVAYKHAQLENTRFDDGKFHWKSSFVGDDEKIHGMTYVYEFEEIGVVVLEEVSYSTIPNVKISVSRPPANLSVNGYPGSFTVMQNLDASKGLTTISWVTDSKLYTISAVNRILRDTPEFNYLMDLVNAVY